MRYTIKNAKLTVQIDSFGAELKSVVNNETGFEYMWCADPEYWKRTSPVLFPFVGDTVNKKYTYKGTEYSMTSHGFARDNEFTLASQTDTEIWFDFKDNESTYVNYPFHFDLQLGYALKDNSLDILWKVVNPGQESGDDLIFHIGAHPAFNCPVSGEADKSGYKLYFGDADVIRHHGNLHGTCTREDLALDLNDHRAVLTPDFFDRSTYIVEGSQTGTVAIETPDGHPYVTVRFETPLFAIWSPTGGKNAPFICIEPWWGRADWDDFSGDMTEREYNNTLKTGETFSNTYTVTFD